MRRLFIIFLISGIYNVSGFAQQDSLIRTQVVKSGRYASVVYTMHDDVLNRKELKSVLYSFQGSATALDQSINWKTSGTVFAVVGVGTGITGLIVNKNNPATNLNSAITILSGCLVMEIVSYIKSDKYFHKSVNIYNHHLNPLP